MTISNLYIAIKHNNLPLHLLCLRAIYKLLLMWQHNGMNPMTITTCGVQWRDQLQKSYFSRGLYYTKIQSTDDLVLFFLYGLRCKPLHQPVFWARQLVATHTLGSQNNAVNVLSSPRAEQCKFWCLAGGRDFFCSSKCPEWLWVQPSLSYDSLLNIKQPQCGTDHPKVKNE